MTPCGIQIVITALRRSAACRLEASTPDDRPKAMVWDGAARGSMVQKDILSNRTELDFQLRAHTDHIFMRRAISCRLDPANEAALGRSDARTRRALHATSVINSGHNTSAFLKEFARASHDLEPALPQCRLDPPHHVALLERVVGPNDPLLIDPLYHGGQDWHRLRPRRSRECVGLKSSP